MQNANSDKLDLDSDHDHDADNDHISFFHILLYILALARLDSQLFSQGWSNSPS